MTHLNCARLLLCSLLVGDVSPTRPVACAASSLYLMLQAHGMPVELDDIADRLPVRESGQSVAELIAAAEEAGIDLEVRDVKKMSRLPNEPFIAFIENPNNDSSIGHFVFIRPIQTTQATAKPP